MSVISRLGSHVEVSTPDPQSPGVFTLTVVASHMNVKPMRPRLIAMFAGMLLAPGCSAIYPLRGIPAAYMPNEYKAPSREGKATIDLSLLQRSQTDQYRIEAGDTLSIYAPGLLGLVDTQPDQPRGDNPPINLPSNIEDRPTLGYPVTVRDDHTIQIPQLPALDVYGLTEREVEDRLKQAVVTAGLLVDEPNPRIVVSIMRRRTYRVLVCRQESATAATPTVTAGTIDIGRTGKGTSRVVELRAGENDVAHALAQPGVDGLPGLDARNVIYVIRSRNARSRGMMSRRLESQPTPLSQGRHGLPSREDVVRGQSPSTSYRSPNGQGPIQYLEATEFKLSGQDIARGSTGPELIDPIPGMNPLVTQRPGTGGLGAFTQNYGSPAGMTQPGLSAPDGPAFRDPTYSTRGQATSGGSPLASDRYGATRGAFTQGSPISNSQGRQYVATSPAFADPTYSTRGPVTIAGSPLASDRYGATAEAFTSGSPINRFEDQQVVATSTDFRDPTFSPRSLAGSTGMRSVTGHSIAPTQDTPPAVVEGSDLQTVQYAVPQSAPWPTSNDAGLPPAIGGGHSLGQPSLNSEDPTEELPTAVESVQPSSTGLSNQGPLWQQTLAGFDPTVDSHHIVKIPVRLAPGENLDLTEEDVTLYDGDIVFIENRDTDVYYVGGLLGGGQFSLPRDRDLHILEAVSLAQGRGMTQGGTQGMQSSGGVSALNRDVTPSASRLIIMRQTGGDQVMHIEVDLYKALRYPHENILVQPGDMLILQYTCVEGVLAFVQRNVLEGALLGIAAGSFQGGGQ